MSFLWRRCTRQQPAIAAALLCASLLMLVCVGVRSASDEAGTLDCSVRVPNYSAAEQQHTRMFLDAIKAAIPALTSVWTCDNFCAHKGVECTEAGLHVRLNVDDLVGSLPEIPEGVIGSSVVVTKLTFSGDISNLKGTLPVSWHQLTSLSSFVFISTGVEDTPPEMRRNSIQSRVMTDDAGFIQAAWASTAQRASSLPVSRVSDNNMIGSPHSAWAGASKMERNYLQKKVDERSLPEEWGNMINIKVLNLTNLSLSGTLPASWASLRLLEQLLASNNLLEGTLPASWGSLKKLLDLQLIGNKFTGIIPQEWGEMTALQRVSLQLDYCTCVPQSWITRKVEVRLYSTVLGGDCEITSDCGSSSSSSELECDGPIPFYTPTQQAHTRNFLEAFKYTITDLQPLWTCTNFCVWEYVHCTPAGVAVEITGTEFFGSVPEVPADVNPSEVVVSKLDFSH
ncbi:proteophosphoglycan ppg4, partial [Leishmania donovani]